MAYSLHIQMGCLELRRTYDRYKVSKLTVIPSLLTSLAPARPPSIMLIRTQGIIESYCLLAVNGYNTRELFAKNPHMGQRGFGSQAVINQLSILLLLKLLNHLSSRLDAHTIPSGWCWEERRV